MKKKKSARADGALAIVDTETTGTSPLYGRVIEVAVLRVEKGKVVRTFHSLVNPERAVQPVIESITGITAAQLETAPLFSEIARELLDILDGALFVAHNVKFDYAFLRNEFRRTHRSFTARCLDTVSLSKRLYPEFLHHDLSKAAEALAEMETSRSVALLTTLNREDVSRVLQELPSDDATLIVSELPEELRDEFLRPFIFSTFVLVICGCGTGVIRARNGLKTLQL